jgi:cystathionine beta-synthase
MEGTARIASSLLDLVGNTPIVRLGRVGAELSCDLVAKVELFNPGGSVKDRPALAMIDEAERQGLLEPGGTIVEPTSGNTGVGLAIVAAQRGYRCVFVMSDKMSDEKVALLRAYGAEVVVCPTAVPPEHPDSYYSVADRLTNEIPGAYRPNQYYNEANPAEHERSTGPEIWEQTAGRVTHFVAGIGTGGTITGVGRYLKAQNPDVQIIGADPEGSVYSGGTGRPYLVEGVGEDFWPPTYDPSVVDRTIMVSDADSFAAARRVTHEEGLLIGGSCGTAVHAALELGRELGPEHLVVVLLPDSGRGYLSKIFNDEWMTRFGFLRADGPRHPRRAGPSRLLADARSRRLPGDRQRRHRAAARGERGERHAHRARADGQGVPGPDRARSADPGGHGAGDAHGRDRRDRHDRGRDARLRVVRARPRGRPPDRRAHPPGRALVPRRAVTRMSGEGR